MTCQDTMMSQWPHLDMDCKRKIERNKKKSTPPVVRIFHCSMSRKSSPAGTDNDDDWGTETDSRGFGGGGRGGAFLAKVRHVRFEKSLAHKTCEISLFQEKKKKKKKRRRNNCNQKIP